MRSGESGNVMLRVALAAAALLLVSGFPSPALAQLTPGFTLNYDAGADDGLNNTWEQSGTAVAGRDITSLTNFTHTLAPVTSVPGISGAYSFTAGGGLLTTFSAFGDTQPASFEMWFRPTDLSGDERLFETGGGNGTALTLGGGTNITDPTNGDPIGNTIPSSHVAFSVTVNSSGTQTARVSYDLVSTPTDFIQVVGTFDVTGNGTSRLYVDGALVGTSNAAAANITDWSGGDPAGVGLRGGANQGGYSGGDQGFSDYDGEIAIFRFYQNKLLTPGEVAQNYHTIAGTTDFFFDNDSGDNAWDTDANWGPAPDTQPSSTQNAYIGNSLTANITQAGEVAADVTVGHNVAAFLAGDGTLTIDDPNATLTATRLRIGTGGEDGTVNFVKGTMTLTGTSLDQSLYVGQDALVSGSGVGTFTMGTLGGNDADTTLTYSGGRFEVCKNDGAEGTFTLNSGTVTGNANFIVTQGDGTANVNIHGGSFTTTTDMNYNYGNGTYFQDGGTVSVDDLNQSLKSGRSSIIAVNGGMLTVNGNLDDRPGTSTINLGGTGRLELRGNSATRETENFNHSGTGALQLALYNNTTGVSPPLNVITAGTFADTPTIELENRILANAATIVNWVDLTDTWDANPVGKWAGNVLPAIGANTIATGTPITVITSPNNMTTPGVLSSGTAGWTVDATDPKAIKMVRTGGPIGAPATARISGAASIVTRNSDLRIAPELGTDAAGLELDNNASLTLSGSNSLIVGGGVTATVNHKGGTLNVGGDLLFGGGFGNQGGTYNLNGGALNVGGDIIEGASGAPSSGVNSAQLHIDGGTLGVAGDITVQRFALGQAVGKTGTYDITGGQNVESTGTTAVGSSGTGTLTLTNGTWTANNAVIGEAASGDGIVNVNGGTVTVPGTLTVGSTGKGSVNLQGGTGHTFKQITIGNANNNASDGTVTVNMPNDTDLITATTVLVGDQGKGTFDLTKGTFTATAGFRLAEDDLATGARAATVTIGTPGGGTSPTLNVSGGNFETANQGTGEVFFHSGTLNQNSNNLIIGQVASSNATFNLKGGTVDIHAGGDMNFNYGTGLFEHTGGLVRFHGGDINVARFSTSDSTYNLDGGTLDLGGGDVTFNLDQAGGTFAFNFASGFLKDVGTFGSTLTQDGGVLQIGASPGRMDILGDYDQNAGILEIEIQDPGLTAGTDFDYVDVRDDALLDGTLKIILLGGYQPEIATTFDVMEADSIAFSPGFLLHQSQAGLPGANEFVARIIHEADLDILRLVVVPEPATLTLLALGGLGLVARRRRRR